MLGCCSTFDLNSICANFKSEINQTDKGIQITIEPEDASKVKALHDLFSAYKDLCDCGC